MRLRLAQVAGSVGAPKTGWRHCYSFLALVVSTNQILSVHLAMYISPPPSVAGSIPPHIYKAIEPSACLACSRTGTTGQWPRPAVPAACQLGPELDID